MLSDIRNAGPVFIPYYNPTEKIIQIHNPSSSEARWSKRELRDHCKLTIRTAMEDHPTHPDRFIYALTGKLFQNDSPLPFGGRRNPGYTQYTGTKCLDLFDWIIEKATDPPVSGRGKKRAAPGQALKVVIEYLNDAMALYRRNLKDELDEVVLKGMSRAGHLSHESKTKLPAYLRESGYDRTSKASSSRIEKPGRVKTHKSKGRETPSLIHHSDPTFDSKESSSEIRMQDKHNLHASKSIERGINSDRIADTPPNSGESRTLIGSIPSAADVQREQHIAYSRHPYHQQPNAHVDDTRNLYAPQQFLYGVIPSAGNFPHQYPIPPLPYGGYHYRHYPYTESVDATPYIHGSFPPSSVILPTTSNTRISQHPVIPYSRYPQHPLSQLHPFEDYPRPPSMQHPSPNFNFSQNNFQDQRTLDPIPNAAHRRRLSESELPDPKRLRKKPPESE